MTIIDERDLADIFIFQAGDLVRTKDEQFLYRSVTGKSWDWIPPQVMETFLLRWTEAILGRRIHCGQSSVFKQTIKERMTKKGTRKSTNRCEVLPQRFEEALLTQARGYRATHDFELHVYREGRLGDEFLDLVRQELVDALTAQLRLGRR